MNNNNRIAVLIDGENISPKYIDLIFDELVEYGIPTYRRVYGDFSNPSVFGWKEELKQHALTPVFQFNYTSGKNASDSALIIDAMDILYSGNVDGVCLVTSDSDFTKLANRLREAGLLVIGMGEQKTPVSLVSACETFKYLDLLLNEEKKFEEPKVQEPQTQNVAEENSKGIMSMKALGREIRKIVEEKSNDEGWINQSEIGVILSNRIHGFDPRNYGYSKLSKLIKSFDYLEIDVVPNPKNDKATIVYVRLK
jgi:uncharacterized LabA/DUF88 family protein